MATRVQGLEIYMPNGPGDAVWRAWCQDFHDTLVALGWVQTADAGQVDIATMARPAENAFTGPEMWRMDDALQATHPVHMRIEYGAGWAASAGGPTFRFQVGLQGTNNAGSLVGVSVTAPRTADTGNNFASTFRNHYASGDSGRLLWYGPYNPAALAGSATVFVERTKDSQGVPTTDGVVCGGHSGAAAYVEQVLRFGGVVPGAAAFALLVPLLPATVTNVGQDLALSPHFAVLGKWRYLWRLSYKTVDLADLAEFDMDYLGAVHHFKSFATSPVALTGTGNGLAMIWE